MAIQISNRGGSGGSSIFIQPTQQIFTSGSGTYALPTGPTPRYIRVRMVGAGGGGGGSPTGGTVGGSGSATTFGSSLLTANGGTGGTDAGAPGLGGTAIINSPAFGTAVGGSDGGGASVASSASNYSLGGNGGCSALGGSGSGGGATPAGLAAAANSGSGGGGGGTGSATTNGGGGGGAGGFIDAIITSPSSTYSYTVGVAGMGGTAGGGGANGANGGAGYIEVTEYYASAANTSTFVPTTAARYTQSSGQSISDSTSTVVNYDTKDYDTDNAVTTGSSWTFTTPAGKGGYYNIQSVVTFENTTWSTGTLFILALYVNGSLFTNLEFDVVEASFTQNAAVGCAGMTIHLNDGDTVWVQVFQSSGGSKTLNTTSTQNAIAITRVEASTSSGGSVRYINARYTQSSAQSIPGGGGDTTVNYAIKDYDSDNAVTTGSSWVFTVPSGGAGKYSYKAKLLFDGSSNWTSGNDITISAYHNGSPVSVAFWQAPATLTGFFVTMQLDDTVNMAVGDTLAITVSNPESTARSLAPNSQYNSIAIERVGT